MLRDEVTIKDKYSGRYMFRDTCFGIVTENISTVMELFTNLGAMFMDHETGLLDNAVIDLVRSMRMDDMGTDTIIYFPGWELTD